MTHAFGARGHVILMTETRGMDKTAPAAAGPGWYLGQALRRPVASDRERVLIVLAFAVLTALRFPNALWHGRFWAEEGSLFYANAWTLPWWEALLFLHTGYLNLTANLAGLLAYLVPLKAAPYVTSGVALVIHCFPAILVVFARDAWLQSLAVLIAALILIAAAPGTEEVWLNSINSQSILIVCVGLILALEPRRGRAGTFETFLLAFAPLTSPGTSALVPLFFLRAGMERSRPRAIQGAILLCGALIQFVFCFDPGERSFGISPLLLNAVLLVKQILLPLFGHHQAAVLANEVALFYAGSAHAWLLWLGTAVFVAVACILATKPRLPSLWFFLAAAVVALVSYVSAQNDKLLLVSVAGSGRYAYAPQVLFALAALSWSVLHAGRTAILARVLVIWMVFVAAHDYFWPSAPDFANGPDWRLQVERWERDPDYRLKLWPRDWTMTLPSPQPSSLPDAP